MGKFPRSILSFSVCLFLIVFLIAISTKFVFMLLPNGVQEHIAYNIFGTQINLEKDILPSADLDGALTDYSSVTQWVFNCIGVDSLESLPENLRDSFFVKYYNSVGGGAFKNESNFTPPSYVERTVQQINKTLYYRRLELSLKSKDAYTKLQATTFITIALGLMTTIFISVSSSEFGKGETKTVKIIKILAIVFPALGTASAAMTAFYAPQEALTKNSGTLSNVSQLHSQIAMDIWTLKCANRELPVAKENMDKIGVWSKRYADIQAISSANQSSNSSAQTQAR